MPSKKILVAGATGLVGHAAMKHFAAVEGREVPRHSKLPVELKVRSSTAPPWKGQP